MLKHLIAEGRRALHELSVGNTFENEKWRVHRYASSVVITDLTNAGKRGKKCREFAVYDIDWKRLPISADTIAKTFEDLAKKNAPLAAMEKAAKEFEGAGASLSIRDQRGVDVTPGGFENIKIKGDNVYIEAEYDTFRIKNLQDTYNEPTCIPALKGGKKDIPQFYRWVKDNEKKIKTMTFSEVLKAMDREGIKYHYFCAMD